MNIVKFLIKGHEIGAIIPFPVWISLFPDWIIPFTVSKSILVLVDKNGKQAQLGVPHSRIQVQSWAKLTIKMFEK